jgi:biotin transporter BioY
MAIGFLIFSIMWAVRKPWETSDAGRYFFTVTMALTILFVAGAFVLTIPVPVEVELWISAIMYPALAVAIWVLAIHAVIARLRMRQVDRKVKVD